MYYTVIITEDRIQLLQKIVVLGLGKIFLVETARPDKQQPEEQGQLLN